MSERQVQNITTTPPRRRKGGVQTNGRFQGTRPTVMKLETLSAKLKTSLSLDFDTKEWQLTIIQRILQRYDVIFTAGTSYGKSLIFEGVAAMAGKKRVCIVVTPLKALDLDEELRLEEADDGALEMDEEEVWEDDGDEEDGEDDE
ncbi:hypothetical protein M407DRAFT_17774 [Tulasnella calospora MUT 4182]|uniref:DEAD/DEAH-box helicase domain-containing protein n=1 Tax=Tulasnella calospora MUT 4182 TaxID=1051891 RepID=A0A0C3MIK1_9AGAM|nr:hypothetical protein M407DRAFT_17774 [Tulasnella calospora MUT 4182]